MENQFGSSNTKAAWDGLKTITGYYKKPAEFPSANAKKLTDDLNEFYCRFDDPNRKGTDNTANISCDSSQNIPEITKEEISCAFKPINVRKSSGSDGLSPMLLRACHLELCDIFHIIYNESII